MTTCITLSPIDRSSSVPLYRLIAQAIQRSVAEGHLTPYQELPSEGELCRYYDVSKITIRQALAELMRDGILYRPRPRSLLAVSPRRYTEEVSRQTGFFVDDSADGDLRAQTQVLEVTTVPAGDHLAPVFGVESGTELYRVERLHFRENEPLALQVSHFAVRRFPGLPNHDLTRSLQQVYERQYGYVATHKVQRLQARLLTAHEADLLVISRRTPIIQIEREVYAGDEVIEHTAYLLRPDRYDLVMHIRCMPAREARSDPSP